MNGVLGMLRLLENEPLTSQQHRYAHLATSSANSLLILINDILDFSKIEAGKLEIEQIEYNLFTELEDIADSAAFTAQEKGLDFQLQLPWTLGYKLTGDPSRLRQILTNFTSNAIKFTHQGAISLTVELNKRPGCDAELLFSVSDTGIGIAADKQAQLFEVFSQVDASTTRQYGGTGLGLSIAKQLVQLMGGSIGVESNPGQGSRFWFSIPLQQASPLNPLTQLSHTNNIHNAWIVSSCDRLPELLKSQLGILGVNDVEIICTNTETAVDTKQLKRALTSKQSLIIIDALLLDPSSPSYQQQSLLVELLLTAMQYTEQAQWLILDRQNGQAFSAPRHSHQLSLPVTPRKLIKALVNPTTASHPEEENKLNLIDNTPRILIVEDNLINQEVALATLEDLGYTANIAANGQEALQALADAPEDKPYLLIFMDCQMPVMDGYQATAAIRNGEHNIPNPQIPIIAMTANAMKGDQKICLDAGMDDYIPKPIEPEIIEEKLKKWLAVELLTAVEAKPDTNNAVASETIAKEPHSIDPSIWDKAALYKRVRGKPERVVKLIGLFLDDMPERIICIETHIQKADCDEVSQLAHAVKGVVSHLGGLKLQALAAGMEKAGKSSDLEQLQRLWPDFSEAYHQLEIILATEYKNLSS